MKAGNPPSEAVKLFVCVALVFGSQASGETPSRKGSEFQVNTLTSGPRAIGEVAMQPGGQFIVVWTDYDAYPWSVRAQRLAVPLIFADGFESGETSSWASSP